MTATIPMSPASQPLVSMVTIRASARTHVRSGLRQRLFEPSRQGAVLVENVCQPPDDRLGFTRWMLLCLKNVEPRQQANGYEASQASVATVSAWVPVSSVGWITGANVGEWFTGMSSLTRPAASAFR